MAMQVPGQSSVAALRARGMARVTPQPVQAATPLTPEEEAAAQQQQQGDAKGRGGLNGGLPDIQGPQLPPPQPQQMAALRGRPPPAYQQQAAPKRKGLDLNVPHWQLPPPPVQKPAPTRRPRPGGFNI